MNEGMNKTILVVEDEAALSIGRKKDLEKLGYRVATAETGEQAIDMAGSSADIDLILMDADLGGEMDGAEAAEHILKHKEIPLVFMFSNGKPEMVNKTEKIISYGYLEKQSGMVVLDVSIKMALELFEEKIIRKQSEEALKASEELREERKWLEHILNITGTGINILDSEFNLQFVDNGWQRVYDKGGQALFKE